MTREYLPFIDWLKTVGLALIVFGHVAHRAYLWWTPPFYAKQLGVAFFVFVTGYTLATERKPGLQVVINRWFEVFVYGLGFAVLMNAIDIGLFNDPRPSDFLPLAGGLNVVFNNFPANPTTWYIGTYLHLLLLWALVVRRLRVGVALLAVALLVEIGVRALFIPSFGPFVGYQFLLNWLTPLLLGVWFGAKTHGPAEAGPQVGVAGSHVGAVLAALVFIAAWPFAVGAIGWRPTFPFMTPTAVAAPVASLLLSVCVSVGYAGFTLSAFTLLRLLPDYAANRFFARNTLIVFIAHMPVFYALESLLGPLVPSYGARATIEFVICFAGIAMLSELIRPAVRPLLVTSRRWFPATTVSGS
jgi:fucose 4-O-acetylase-like acetyltransferase